MACVSLCTASCQARLSSGLLCFFRSLAKGTYQCNATSFKVACIYLFVDLDVCGYQLKAQMMNVIIRGKYYFKQLT